MQVRERDMDVKNLVSASLLAVLVAAWPGAAAAEPSALPANVMLNEALTDELLALLRESGNGGGGGDGHSSCEAICLLWGCNITCYYSWQTAYCSCAVVSVDLNNGITIGFGEASCYCSPPW